MSNTEEKDKANILNTLFIEQIMSDESQAALPQTVKNATHKLDSIIVTPEEVRDTFKLLRIGKAAVPDLINNRLLKELAQPLALPLSDLFNLSISFGSVPHILKQANVTPVDNKTDPSDVSNYRLISLLSTVSKVLEKIAHKYLFNFSRDNNVITPFQLGFCPR